MKERKKERDIEGNMKERKRVSKYKKLGCPFESEDNFNLKKSRKKRKRETEWENRRRERPKLDELKYFISKERRIHQVISERTKE